MTDELERLEALAKTVRANGNELFVCSDGHIEADEILRLIERLRELEGRAAEPVAWMSHHDEPLLFLNRKEAESYCDDDEHPIPLYTAPPPQRAVSDEMVERAYSKALDQRASHLIEGESKAHWHKAYQHAKELLDWAAFKEGFLAALGGSE